MHLDNKNTIKLNELIHWVKKELLSPQIPDDDTLPLFVIEEVTVEVNFVLAGESEGGFDLQIVNAGAKISEERVQKAIVKMKPLIPYERVREKINVERLKNLEDKAIRVIVKGMELSEQSVPPRE
jgi:hypothetical protein